MTAVSYDDLTRMHAQLVALAEAGASLDAGLGNTPQEIASTLEGCAAALARRTGQGLTLAKAVEEEESLPKAYRAMILTGLRTGRLLAPFDQGERQAMAVQDMRAAWSRGAWYPALLAALAVLGVALLCLVTLPAIEGVYQQMRKTPNASALLLAKMRMALPWWGPLAPVAVFCGWRLWRRWVHSIGTSTGRLTTTVQRWVGIGRCLELAEQSLVARQMAELLENGASRDASLKLATESRGVAQATPLRPLLAWTIAHAPDDVQLAAMLRFVAAEYASLGERRLAWIRAVVPMTATATIGGAAVLSYGLLTMTPIVGLVHSLAE